MSVGQRAYRRAFEAELACMSASEFQRWNPAFSLAESDVRIARARAYLDRIYGVQEGQMELCATTSEE